MASLQQVTIDGKTIWVEVADVQGDSPQGERFANTSASSSLCNVDISATLQTLLAPVYRTMQAMKPDEVNVEVTLGFGVKGDLFVAKGEGNAALKVSAKWKFDGKP